jgi:hypothetical protein
MFRLITFVCAVLVAALLSAASLSAQQAEKTKTEEKKSVEQKVAEKSAKEKYVPPPNVLINQAKALRMAKLLGHLYVLNELDISDEVYATLTDLQQRESTAESRFHLELMKEQTSLPPPARDAHMATFMPAYKTRRGAALEDFAYQRFILLSGPQMERLSQMDFQEQGVNAFSTEDVVAVLKLSDDQKQQLAEIRATYEPKLSDLFKLRLYFEKDGVRSTDPAVMDVVRERSSKIEQILNKEQVDKLAKLRGKPVELANLDVSARARPRIERALPWNFLVLMKLISYEAVRRELKMTPLEESDLSAAQEKYDRASRSEINELPREGLSAVQRDWLQLSQVAGQWLKVQKLELEFAAVTKRCLNDSRLKRLDEISLQRDWRILRVSGDPGAAFGSSGRYELELSRAQVSKMVSIEKDFHHRRAALFSNGEGKENLTRIKEFKAEEETQLREILTPEQRQKLKELQGPPFDVSIFDPLTAFSPPPANTNGRDPLETKFDQSVIDYVNGTLLREQDTNGDGSIDKSEWVKGKWSVANPPENSDLNKDDKLSREELCIRISKSRGIPIKGEQPQPLPDSSK